MAISISNITQTSFTVNWTSHGTSVSNYNIEIRQGTTIVHDVYSIGSGVRSYAFYGLVKDTIYEVKLYSRNSSGTVITIEYSYPRTHPLAPSTPTNLRVYDSTNTQISLAWNTVANADYYAVEVFHSATNSLIWYNYTITGGSVAATGLTNGVAYNVKLYARNAGGNSSPIWLYGVVVGNIRPQSWSWSITKNKGSTYNISNSQVTNLVSYSEIVGFQNRINEFRTYKNLGLYSFSSRSQGQAYTSAISNQLKASINSMSPPISTGTSTNVIDNLNRLRDSLNSIQ